MAIEQGIWRIGDQPQKLKSAALADESLLEDQVMKDTGHDLSPWVQAEHSRIFRAIKSSQL
ncbi:hypothetical protein CLH61_06125 [Marinobacter profundi]|uniref:Uncharacterized protein n=1 Tax=Marinobacter profundi TaxID=2666256 RepID=A0A2G1UMK3_9GAMM|nr:hypothetical protein CLH61_06125 [Marinobacter profundi]